MIPEFKKEEENKRERQKILSGLLVSLRIPKPYGQAEADPFWGVAQALVSMEGLHVTDKSLLLPQERHISHPWEADIALRLSLSCKEAMCES